MNKSLNIVLYVILGLICFGLGFLVAYLSSDKESTNLSNRKYVTSKRA